MVLGRAGDILKGSVLTFDTQNLNSVWTPVMGNNTGPGTFHVARVTLKDTAVSGRAVGAAARPLAGIPARSWVFD